MGGDRRSPPSCRDPVDGGGGGGARRNNGIFFQDSSENKVHKERSYAQAVTALIDRGKLEENKEDLGSFAEVKVTGITARNFQESSDASSVCNAVTKNLDKGSDQQKLFSRVRDLAAAAEQRYAEALNNGGQSFGSRGRPSGKASGGSEQGNQVEAEVRLLSVLDDCRDNLQVSCDKMVVDNHLLENSAVLDCSLQVYDDPNGKNAAAAETGVCFQDACCNTAEMNKEVIHGEQARTAPKMAKEVEKPNAWRKPNHLKIEWNEEEGKFNEDGAIILDLHEVYQNQRKLEQALVGKILGKSIPFAVILSELRKKWGQWGRFQLVTHGDNCFTCIFDNPDACDYVMLGGPWFIGGQVMGLDFWSPSFNHRSLAGLSAPIWVRLPGLPLLYWDNTNLARIASMIGKPLWIDAQTKSWGRSNYARVCVKLDLSKRLPKGVWIMGLEGKFFQNVEFEGIPVICSNCGYIGHKMENCKVVEENCCLRPGLFQEQPRNVNGGEVLNKMVPASSGLVIKENPVSLGMKEVLNSCSELEKDSRGEEGWTMVNRARGKSKGVKEKGIVMTSRADRKDAKAVTMPNRDFLPQLLDSRKPERTELKFDDRKISNVKAAKGQKDFFSFKAIRNSSRSFSGSGKPWQHRGEPSYPRKRRKPCPSLEEGELWQSEDCRVIDYSGRKNGASLPSASGGDASPSVF